MKYRKKPVIIEAMELTFDERTQDKIIRWINEGPVINSIPGPDGGIYLETLEGRMFATTGDYIIKSVKGEFYPCKPDIFELTYESVDN
jgi:hypothetical protein